MNFIKFFEPPVVVAFYLLLAVALLPPVNRFVAGVFASMSRAKALAAAKKWKFAIFLLLSVGAAFAFRALQVKYIFLGDVGIRPSQIEQGEIISDEYLSMCLLIRLYGYLHAAWEYTGLQTIQLVAYVTGGLFIFISLLTADALGKTFLKKLACFTVATLSLAALMQFCGYAEIYTLALLFLQLYLYLCVLHLQGKIGVIFPAITLAVSIAVHHLLVCMVPSLIFLFYRSVLWKRPFFRKRSTLIGLGVAALPVIYYFVTRIAYRVMLPLSPGEKNLLTMFSVAHYKEFANHLLQCGGFVSIVWVAVLLFYLLGKVKFAALHWFYFIASGSITGLMFVFNNIRGSGDWDIISFTAVVNNALAIILLLNLHERKVAKNIKYGVCAIAVFALLHTSFWIATNASDKSIGWVEKAFEKDPANYYKGSFSNESMLGAIFSSNNLKEKSLYWEKKAYQRHSNDPRTGFNYANVLIREGKVDEAVKIYEASIDKFPAYALPYMQLVDIYLKNQSYEALYRLLAKMEAVYKQDSSVFTSRFSQEQLSSCFDILRQLEPSFR
ncbi:MAG: hypothetical protein LBB79_02105 [Prevotellaceae bacterium]|nr:hypothetical protein [Prevotellaceae bacterium]